MSGILYITNVSVNEFYASNPDISIEDVNLWIVRLFEKCMNKNKNINNEKIFSEESNEIAKIITTSKLHSYIKKGESGENQMELILNKLDETAQIINGTTKKICGDFNIIRIGKPIIFIENKEGICNIGIELVEKFIQDSKDNGYSGILVSQHSGIINKQDFYIDIFNGNILVYIHNADYDFVKIKTAVNIIDKLHAKLQDFNMSPDKNVISQDVLDEINKEFQLFIEKKNSIVSFIKDSQKKLLSQIEDVQFIHLDKYLSIKYTSIQPKETYKCTLCNFYTANSLKALAAHKRGCKKKHIITGAV